LVPRDLSRVERVLVNVCWRYWIPLFSVLYRLNNFWNWPRLLTLFSKPAERRRLATNMLGLIAGYAVVIVIVGPSTMVRLSGAALLLTLIAEDLLLLSQHTHIPQHLSGGELVRPFPTIEQEVFTRSLVFPRWLSALLLHIDAHELHHMYPHVPGYALHRIDYLPQNRIHWLRWLVQAKRLPADVFLFQNRRQSGAHI
jgi:acyl-lipid omega-6 desaturase (Delta-12 desaturase)